MKTEYSPLLILLNIFVMFQFGCGGGGSADTSAIDTGEVEQGDSNINGDTISGRLFMGGDNDGLILNLATGKYSIVPGVDWSENEDNEYHPMAQYAALPSIDGSEFVVTISNCLRTNDKEYPSLFDDCIEIHDSTGNIIGSGKMLENISRKTRMSRDKQYIAFFYNDGRYQGRNDELVIFDRNFQFINRSMLPGYLARSFDWLNDNGQLVYIHDQTIYVTAPYDTDGTAIYTFSEDEGRPDYIAASPDGDKIAFTLVSEASYRSIHGTTWVMNSDGTDLHQLAYVPGNEYPIINYPTWSPDGAYIMNMVGYVTGADFIDMGVLGGLYAIPSASQNIAINDNGENGIVHIKSYFHSNELNYDFTSNGNLVWIP
ncbi:MAG: hypothetical protein ABW139_00010 [Candidatus Thiodiazotropha sp. DIVDIV]